MAEKEELGKLIPTSYVKTAGLTSKLYLYGSNPKEHIKDFENWTKENTIVQGEIYLAMALTMKLTLKSQATKSGWNLWTEINQV